MFFSVQCVTFQRVQLLPSGLNCGFVQALLLQTLCMGVGMHGSRFRRCGCWGFFCRAALCSAQRERYCGWVAKVSCTPLSSPMHPRRAAQPAPPLTLSLQALHRTERELAALDSKFLPLDGVELHYKARSPRSAWAVQPPPAPATPEPGYGSGGNRGAVAGRHERGGGGGSGSVGPAALRGVHCLHGFGASAYSWSFVQDELAQRLGAVVTAHDMPGFGLTQRRALGAAGGLAWAGWRAGGRAGGWADGAARPAGCRHLTGSRQCSVSLCVFLGGPSGSSHQRMIAGGCRVCTLTQNETAQKERGPTMSSRASLQARGASLLHAGIQRRCCARCDG